MCRRRPLDQEYGWQLSLLSWLAIRGMQHTSALFLDFDGVLHRGTTGTFRKVPLLDEILRRSPSTAVVLSTDWRHSEDLASLRGYFSDPETVLRVVDALPILSDGPARRHREVEQWLRLNRWAKRYLAADDTPELFPAGCPYLYLTDRREGLTPLDVDAIVQRLQG